MLPIFRANFTNNEPFRINFNSFQLYVCVSVFFETSESVSRWLHLFRATHNYFALKLHCFQSNCSYNYESSLGAVLLTSLKLFSLCQLSCTDEKNKTNCIAKILISAWRVVGNLLLINVELDKNSQLFVVRINASQLFDEPSHGIFLMFANICWWWVHLKVYWGSQLLHFCMQKEKL